MAAAAILGSMPAPASAAPVPGTVNQCNYIQDGGGNEIACDVTVTNYLDLDTGLSSSVIVVKTCEGKVATTLCTELPVTFPTATTVIDQCNNSANGGGSIATCNVSVVNVIIGDATVAPATINQCNRTADVGTAPTLNCSSIEETTGATITQCNDSLNGGGGQRQATCSVLPSTVSTALPVTIRQCNGSVNGGGSYLTCTASLTHQFLPAGSVIPGSSATPVASDTATSTPSATTPASPLLPVGGGGTGNGSELAETGTDALPVFLIAGGALLAGGVLLAVMMLRRRSERVR